MSQATTCCARSTSPLSSRSSTNSLLAISTSEVLSTIGMSCSSSCVCLADRIGTAASLTVVQPMPAYRYPVAKVVGVMPPRPARSSGVCRNFRRGALVLRDEPAGEVEGAAGDVGVDVDAAGKHDHAARVDRAAALDLSDDPAIGDADVLDDAVDPVRRIVDLPAGYPQHRGPSQECVRAQGRMLWCVRQPDDLQA